MNLSRAAGTLVSGFDLRNCARSNALSKTEEDHSVQRFGKNVCPLSLGINVGDFNQVLLDGFGQGRHRNTVRFGHGPEFGL